MIPRALGATVSRPTQCAEDRSCLQLLRRSVENRVVFIGFVESPAWEGMPSAHPVSDAFRVHSKDFPIVLPYRYRLLPASSHPECGAWTC